MKSTHTSDTTQTIMAPCGFNEIIVRLFAGGKPIDVSRQHVRRPALRTSVDLFRPCVT